MSTLVVTVLLASMLVAWCIALYATHRTVKINQEMVKKLEAASEALDRETRALLRQCGLCERCGAPNAKEFRWPGNSTTLGGGELLCPSCTRNEVNSAS